MAKNRNKKRKVNGASTAMDITSDHTVSNLPQAMDTSESSAQIPPLGGPISIRKGVQMKRSKSVRKMKARAKAVSKTEKSLEKVLKSESKILRTQSAKKLYD